MVPGVERTLSPTAPMLARIEFPIDSVAAAPSRAKLPIAPPPSGLSAEFAAKVEDVIRMSETVVLPDALLKSRRRQ